MPKRWPILFNILVAAACLVLFVGAGHFAANALISTQNMRQLEELNRVALRRSETAVAFGAQTLDELALQGAVACDPGTLQNVRLHVYRRGAVKDIRVVRKSGAVLCSAYSETLEFDKGWVTREDMLSSEAGALRLFRVEQFFGTALGIMRDVGADRGLVAILGLSGSLFDIVPAELRDHSVVALRLADGQTIVRSSAAEEPSQDDLVGVETESDLYPLRTVIGVEAAALSGWNRWPYTPIVAASALLGMLFAVLAVRAIARPDDPVAEFDRAIATGQIRPYLQPIFALDDKRIIGAEMLARWVRSDGVVIPPARFIELAEHSGRIQALTWQLMSRTLNDLKPLLKGDRSFRLSVNISPRHFVMPDFVSELRGVVTAAGVANRQVALELTEREAFSDPRHAASVVAEVQDHGFKVAIDDVGIGHSGLSQIQTLRPDILKIDKFFVDTIDINPSARIVVEMLVKLAGEMDMTIVAEGIEQAEQASALAACGVGNGQGYLVAPPLPVDRFLRFLEDRKSNRAAVAHIHRAA